jgi:hypothetical protein
MMTFKSSKRKVRAKVNSNTPIVDLSSLPIDLQAIEYHYRTERGKVHPKAVEVTFRMNKTAREIASSDWYSGQFFLAS